MTKLKKFFIGSLVGFINGFFASGGGIVAVLSLKKFMKLEEKKAHATAIAVILPLSLASIVVYTHGGFGNFPYIVKASIGGIIGAFVGAKLLNKLKKEYISLGFGIIMVIAGVRMFFK